MTTRAAVVVCIGLVFAGCGGGSPGSTIPICEGCPPVAPSMLVAERGAGEIAIYDQLPSTDSPISTIAAPGAESLAVGLVTENMGSYEQTIGSPVLYVGEYPNAIAVLDSPYANVTTTITAGIDDPAAVAIMAIDGNEALFVANRAGNDVTIYESGNDEGGFESPAVTIAGLSAPDGLAFDAQGDLWVAQSAGVVEFKPPFTASSTPAIAITNGLKSPSAIAFDLNGSLYVADKGSNAIVVYSPGTVTPAMTVTNGMSGPAALLISGEALLVTNAVGNDVAEFNLPLTSASAPVATNSSGMNQPSSLAFLYVP